MAVTDIKERLYQRLHKLLKNPFWEEFIEALAEEVDYVESDIDDKKVFNQIEEQTEDRLIDIAEKFGYTPNLILDNSLDYLKREVKTIPYRIKNKATLNGFLLAFNMIPEKGQVFNVFYDGQKLIRSFDVEQTLLNIGGYTFGNIFYGFQPEIYFSSLLDDTLELDSGFILDADDSWFLDVDLIKKTTQHLAVEYQSDYLYTESGDEYLFLPEYYEYLMVSSEYNRKASSVIHDGINLSMVTDQSGFINANNRTDSYTIPALKLNASITPVYTSKIETLDMVSLDDGRELDEAITWSLDQGEEATSGLQASDFFYIVAGTEQKGQFEYNIGNLYEFKTVHYGFDEYHGEGVTDESRNSYDAVISGDNDRVNGIIGNTVNFDGSTSVDSVSSSVVTTNSDKTIQFWIKTESVSSGLYYIINHGYIKVWIDQSSNEMNVFLEGAGGNDTYTFAYTPDNEEHLIQVEIDQTNTGINVFQDTSLLHSADISAIGDISGTYGLNIGWDGTGNYFQGLIDDFLIVERIFSDEEKTYIYDNKLGSLLHVSDLVYREKLSLNEIYEDDNYFIIQSTISSNTVNDEYVATGDDATQTFSGSLKQNNLIGKTVKFYYLDSTGATETIQDNGQGDLLGEKAVGTIDYTNGDYSLTTEREYKVIKDQSVSADERDTVSFATNINIKENSFSCQYYISGTEYIASDDGSGNVVGVGVDTGSINYTTGIVELTFDSTTDNQPIWSSYIYIKSDIIPDGVELLSKYSTNDNLEITEVGVESSSKELLIYSTFPPYKFGTNKSHLGVQFIVLKN